MHSLQQTITTSSNIENAQIPVPVTTGFSLKEDILAEPNTAEDEQTMNKMGTKSVEELGVNLVNICQPLTPAQTVSQYNRSSPFFTLVLSLFLKAHWALTL